MLVGVEYYRLAGFFFSFYYILVTFFIGKFDFVCSTLYNSVKNNNFMRDFQTCSEF